MSVLIQQFLGREIVVPLKNYAEGEARRVRHIARGKDSVKGIFQRHKVKIISEARLADYTIDLSDGKLRERQGSSRAENRLSSTRRL